MTVGDVTSVQCLSTHLTSFAVLVDVAGGLQVCSECHDSNIIWLCISMHHLMKAVVNLSFVGNTRRGAQGFADCFIHWMCHLYNLPYYFCPYTLLFIQGDT